MSDPHHGQRDEADAVAAQLLKFGWVVRSPHRTGPDQVPLLLVSRTAFEATPVTVHVLPHHHLELEARDGATVDTDDLADLHHHLNDFARQQTEAS